MAYPWRARLLCTVWLSIFLPSAGQAAVAETSSVDPLTRAIRDFISVGGFADINLTSSDRTTDQLRAGEIDLYATAHFSENWSAQIETIAVKDNQVHQTLPEPQLERLYLAYSPSDALRVEVGKIHTGIVQWNEREHRTRFLQTPIDVPAIARREERNGAWPLHFIGLWISGRSNNRLGFSYGIGAGDGRGDDRTDTGSFSQRRPVRAKLLTIGVAPERLRGWSFAMAGYLDTIPTPAEPLRERDLTLSTSYVRGNAEMRAEWSGMRHEARNTGLVYRSRGWYLLLSDRLSGRWRSIRPYVLIDELAVDGREQYLRGAGDEHAVAAGLRWDPVQWFTWKADFRTQNFPTDGRERLLRVQVAFAF